MRRLHGAPVLAVVLAAVLLVAVLISACGTGSTKPEFDEEIVVFGYLYVGESVSGSGAIRLDRTLPVDQYYDAGRAAILNAVVTLQEDSTGVADTLSMAAPGVYANPSVVIRESTTYRLKAIVGGRTVTATTTTPLAFETLREPRITSAGTMTQSTISDSFPIVVACPDSEQIFLVDVYCLEEWQNARFVHRFGGANDTPQSYDEYGGSNGEPRHISAYFRLQDIPPSGEGYRIGFYGDMMWFYGRHEVGVFSIDANYYNYLYRDHPELHGGVTGGIGVFGSACRRQYEVEVVE